ncbi:MAG: hypothetical protein Q9157_000255 [Trypethelium eluteriae]
MMDGINGHDSEVAEIRLPSARPAHVSENVVLQPPLSRRGDGPGLIILAPRSLDLNGHEKTLDPPPLQKWAEEGYAVAQVLVDSEESAVKDDFELAYNNLLNSPQCQPKTDFGIISYHTSSNVQATIQAANNIAGAVFYGACNDGNIGKPFLCHIAGQAPKADISQPKNGKSVHYPSAGPFFTIPAHPDFSSSTAAISHTRTLAFLKPLMKGPHFDLEAIWEEHTMLEFATRSPERTMSTMVQEPYVNHVPTMTGGIGRERLTNFYRFHFIFNNPDDTALELVSRTVGIDRVIDEFIFSFTHDKKVDWILPGLPPTFKAIRIPMTSVVNIRGDRLYHEHIAWDQASVLRQLGLLPEYLPFPYPIDGIAAAKGERYEFRVPAGGAETAGKLVDERSVDSNRMFEFDFRRVKI